MQRPVLECRSPVYLSSHRKDLHQQALILHACACLQCGHDHAGHGIGAGTARQRTRVALSSTGWAPPARTLWGNIPAVYRLDREYACRQPHRSPHGTGHLATPSHRAGAAKEGGSVEPDWVHLVSCCRTSPGLFCHGFGYTKWYTPHAYV